MTEIPNPCIWFLFRLYGKKKLKKLISMISDQNMSFFVSQKSFDNEK